MLAAEVAPTPRVWPPPPASSLNRYEIKRKWARPCQRGPVLAIGHGRQQQMGQLGMLFCCRCRHTAIVVVVVGMAEQVTMSTPNPKLDLPSPPDADEAPWRGGRASSVQAQIRRMQETPRPRLCPGEPWDLNIVKSRLQEKTRRGKW